MDLPGGEDELVSRLTQRLLSVIHAAPEAGAALSIDLADAFGVFQEYHREHECNIMRRNLDTAEKVDLIDQTQEAPFYMRTSYLFTHFLDTMHLGREDASVLSCPQSRFFMGGTHRDPDFAQYAFFVNGDSVYDRIKVLGSWVEVKPDRVPKPQAAQNIEGSTHDAGSEALGEPEALAHESEESGLPIHIVDLITNRVQLSEQFERAFENYHGDSMVMFFMHGHRFTAFLCSRPKSLGTANAAQDPSLSRPQSTSNIPPVLPELEPLNPRTFKGTHFWQSEVQELLKSCAEDIREQYWEWVEEKYPEPEVVLRLEDLRKRFDAEMTAENLVSMHPQPVYVGARILEGDGDSLRASHRFTNTLRLAHSGMAADVTFEESVFFGLAHNESAYRPSDQELRSMVDLMGRWYLKTLHEVWNHEFEDIRECSMQDPDSSREASRPKNSRLNATVRSPPRLRPRNSTDAFGEQPLGDLSGESDGDDSALAVPDQDSGHAESPSTHTGSVDHSVDSTGDVSTAATSLPDAASHSFTPASPPPGAAGTTSQFDTAIGGDASVPHEGSALGHHGGGHGGTQPLSIPPIGGITLGNMARASRIPVMLRTTSTRNAPVVLAREPPPITNPRYLSSVRASNLLNDVFDLTPVGPPVAFSTPVSSQAKNAGGGGSTAWFGPKKGSSRVASVAVPSTNANTSATTHSEGRGQAMAGPSHSRSEDITPGYQVHTKSSVAKGKAPAKDGPPRKDVKRKKRSEPDDSAAYEPPGQPKKKAKMGQPG